MNLNDFLNDLYGAFAYLQTDTNGPARATRWVNQAYQEICDLEDWPFLETTATGTAPLTVADLGEVESVLDATSKTKLEQADWRSLTDTYADLTITGAAVFFYITAGSVINVFPANTTVTLSVRYYKNPADLANALDTPVVPAAFHDVILLGAFRRAYLEDGAGADYQMVAAEFDRRVNVMRTALLVDPEAQVITAGSQDGWL